MAEACTTNALARHILKVAPKSAKVVFENDVVRLIEVTMKKGQRIPMHSHNKGLSYSMSEGKIRSTSEGGKSRVFNVKKGDVGWSDKDGAETHAVENLGGVLWELSVEFKGKAPLQ
jgi:quercetin dioxygenase-like cupin family protein